MEVLYRLSYRGIFRLCGGGRIRTSVGEAGRFTVCSLWPLGHTPGHAPAALCAERPNMVANATDFSTDEKGLQGTSNESPGRDSNPRPAAYKAAALPLSYPGTHRRRRTLASPAPQHAPASGYRFSTRSGPRSSPSARFGPSVHTLSKGLSRPARRHSPEIVTAQAPSRHRPSLEVEPVRAWQSAVLTSGGEASVLRSPPAYLFQPTQSLQ